jgi:hypothetical protein
VRKSITYAVAMDSGLVVSRVGSELAWPVLDYDHLTPANGFESRYRLEKIGVMETPRFCWDMLRWTKKVPTAIKNLHREFWGMKPLKEEDNASAG